MGSCNQKALTAALLMSLSAGAALAGECRDDQVMLRGDWGEAQFAVEVADDDEERARGLMHRESMPRSSGMLFVYPGPQAVGFWMKNTLIPLDMLFADKTGTVRYVHRNAEPLSERAIFGGNNIQYVLEINAGLTEQLGLKKGTEMRHPSMDANMAAWPC